jgi:nitrile hydratase
MHDGHDHAHPLRPDRDEHPGYYQVMATALRELLLEKNVFTAEELRRQMEKMDERGPHLGTRVVARAWADPAFKARLLADGPAACRELGVDIGPTRLVVLENRPELHNLVVCTLCSCYPRSLLGLPPDWYKSVNYRRRAVREPRAVLEEFGTRIPDGTAVRVHDSTAELRYIVLPMRPAGAEGLDEAALAALVTRDAMIGVALPKAP